MSEASTRQFGLRWLFWVIFLAALAASLLAPNTAVTAGFIVTFLVLVGLQFLIGRLTRDREFS